MFCCCPPRAYSQPITIGGADDVRPEKIGPSPLSHGARIGPHELLRPHRSNVATCVWSVAVNVEKDSSFGGTLKLLPRNVESPFTGEEALASRDCGCKMKHGFMRGTRSIDLIDMINQPPMYSSGFSNGKIFLSKKQEKSSCCMP